MKKFEKDLADEMDKRLSRDGVSDPIVRAAFIKATFEFADQEFERQRKGESDIEPVGFIKMPRKAKNS